MERHNYYVIINHYNSDTSLCGAVLVYLMKFLNGFFFVM